MNEKWFEISIAEIEKKLKTNAASGLSRKAARSAWYRYAPKYGTLFTKKKKRAGKMLAEIMADFALIMLLMVALLAVLFDEAQMGSTVIVMAAVNVILSFVFYYRAQRSLERLEFFFLPTAKVIRGGKLYRTSFDNVVPGDVVLVEKGDVVCADMRLVTSDNLSVAMRVDKSKYITVGKQAQGVINANENDPSKHLNILHAGSVVREGSARAIVFATGKYTYLGAMTGGIVEPFSDNVPGELKKMRKLCSQISLFSLIAVLPFSMLSLILSSTNGGTAMLSVAFLTALAISASSMAQLSYTVCKIFFINKIRDIFKGREPMAIRTTDAFDRLFDTEYLFMLDGASVTDGVLHFESAFTAEGDVAVFVKNSSTVTTLLEMVSLFESADSGMLTVGINPPDRYKKGLGELLSKGKIDTDALKIRCPIRSYIPGTATDPIDRVFYTDSGRSLVLEVSRTPEIFSQCTRVLTSSGVQILSNVGADNLRHTYMRHVESSKTVLVFTLSTPQSTGAKSDKTFVGAVVLREGVDRYAARAISMLSNKGVKVITFPGSNTDSNAPAIPIDLQRGVVAHRDEFIKSGVPVTYKFGEIDTYYGLSSEEIELLLEHAHEKGKAVSVLGFSDFARNVTAKADVFISCAALVNIFSAKNEQELYNLEIAGARASASCEQTVKENADILIPRPNGKNGGIAALVNAMSVGETAYRNLNGFFKYVIAAQLIRVLTVSVPALLGKPLLDARHLLLCSFILDMFVLLMLAGDRTVLLNAKRKQFAIASLGKHIKNESRLMITSLVATAVVILIPVLSEYVFGIGNFTYSMEFNFLSILWLHLLLCYYVRYGSVKKIKGILKNQMMLAIFAGVILVAVVILLIPSVPDVFGMQTCNALTVALSFVPAFVFALVYELIPLFKKRK